MGRPALWGLAHSGEEGVKKILAIIKREFESALAISGKTIKLTLLFLINQLLFAGCATVKDITRDMVVHESYYSRL